MADPQVFVVMSDVYEGYPVATFELEEDARRYASMRTEREYTVSGPVRAVQAGDMPMPVSVLVMYHNLSTGADVRWVGEYDPWDEDVPGDVEVEHEDYRPEGGTAYGIIVRGRDFAKVEEKFLEVTREAARPSVG